MNFKTKITPLRSQYKKW